MRQCPFCGRFFIPSTGMYHRHAQTGTLKGHPDLDPITMGTCWRCAMKNRDDGEIVPLDQGDMFGAQGQ